MFDKLSYCPQRWWNSPRFWGDRTASVTIRNTRGGSGYSAELIRDPTAFLLLPQDNAHCLLLNYWQIWGASHCRAFGFCLSKMGKIRGGHRLRTDCFSRGLFCLKNKQKQHLNAVSSQSLLDSSKCPRTLPELLQCALLLNFSTEFSQHFFS